ncbi:MAG: DUF72 domain-containing protein [Opitutaceae bacterium]|nr:DUF72 domain-containing protein [Cytophagales bacterium]
METKGILRIGTSGIVVPGKKTDYPEIYRSGSRLAYYSSLFPSVEINSTFHKVPKASTFAKWSSEVPESFKFTIKLWRGITHAKKLKFNLQDIDFFIEAASQIENKKGCLLVQFPGSITSDYSEEVEEILHRINTFQEEYKWQVAIELRNISWYQEVTYDLLDKYGVSLVYHDLAASKPSFISQKVNIVYLRFHGPTGNYRDSYSEQFLNAQAISIRNWLLENKEVYVYFNNTMGGALNNARYLQDILIRP